MKKYTFSELNVLINRLLELKALEEDQIDSFNDRLMEITENGKDENSIDTTSYSVQIETLTASKNRCIKHLTQINKCFSPY